jgi:hypothetical protein
MKRFFSKSAKGGDKQPRSVAMEISGPQGGGGQEAAVLAAALRPLQGRYGSQIANVELHISPPPVRWLVAFTTTPITQAEAAEFESLAEKCLTSIGPRLR